MAKDGIRHADKRYSRSEKCQASRLGMYRRIRESQSKSSETCDHGAKNRETSDAPCPRYVIHQLDMIQIQNRTWLAARQPIAYAHSSTK